VIRASRAAYLVCGVLTALALAGWGVRAAGAPHSNTTSNTASNATVPLAAPTNTQAPGGTAGGDYGAAAPQAGGDAAAANGNAAPAAAVGSKTTKLVAKTIARMGQVVTDDKGWVLYRFDKDTANPPASNCKDKCAQVWPPLLSSDGNVPQLEGVDSTLVGTIQRADGGNQITLGGWPLYRYVGDKTPGKWTGQAVGGTWFVSSPTGKKNLTCLPTSTPTAAAPPAAGDAGSNSGSGGY
jgi:predicted lipoprotein with Yx(FWY)xxD motif